MLGVLKQYMIKHEHQRVGVFIDVQNMYYTAKKLWNSKVDFGEILEAAKSGRQYIRGIAYVVEATGEEAPFFEALHQRGLETKMRGVTVFASGAKKADWDIGMAVDAIRIGEILDVVVLVTGDGDFVELVEYLRHHGRQVEVISFKETTNNKLIEVADDYTNLSDDLSRFLIRTPHHPQTKTKDIQKQVVKPEIKPVTKTNNKPQNRPAQKPISRRRPNRQKRQIKK